MYTFKQVTSSQFTIQLYIVTRSNHGDLSGQNPVDHASLSNEETRNIKKELDEIDKKFDEARGVKFKVKKSFDHADLSNEETITNDETGEDGETATIKASEHKKSSQLEHS